MNVLGWQDRAEKLKELIASIGVDGPIADTPDFGVVFEPEANRAMHLIGVEMVLRIIASTSLGHEVIDDPDEGELVVSRRRMTIQIFCESIEDRDDHSANIFLENVALRIWRTSSQEALISAGFGLVSASDILPVQLTHQGRKIDARTLDLVLNLDVSERDISTIGKWIEKVTVEGFIGAPYEYQEEIS